MPPDVQPTSLPDLAGTVRERVERFRRLREVGNVLGTLSQRSDDLRKLADKARPLAAARQVLPPDVPLANLPTERLAVLRDRLEETASRCATDPDALVQPTAVEVQPLKRVLDDAEKALRAAWSGFAQAPIPGEAMVSVLERFAPFGPAVWRFKEQRATLEKLATQLPATLDQVDKVQKQRDGLLTILKSLEAQGLDPDVLDFLRRCPAGYPLEELLARPVLVEWLRGQGILASLQVRAGTEEHQA